jgi:DNA-directed RNA polymerase specialized sigma24 family protein
MSHVKPTIDEVLEFATKSVQSHIRKNASQIPEEQKEEISQNALLRAFRAYENLDPEQTWQAFISFHCQGAVKDYLKQGHGFIHHKSQRYARDTFISQVSAYNDEDDTSHSTEKILGAHGVFTEGEDAGAHKINWDLVSRMASVDHTIHLVAKILLGFNIAELAVVFDVSRERLSQRYHSFLAELSSPEEARDPWLNQALFAFGVSDHAVDNGLGFEYQPIDLYSLKPVDKDKGIHKSAISWVKELYPDLLSIKKANIDWDLVSKLARHDEQLHLVATILLGKSPAEICDYFDIGMNAARSKVQRFVARLDSPEHYQDPWTNQVINALGLYKMFGQEPRFTDFGVGLTPINLTDFNTPRFKYDRGDQLSLLLIIPGQKLQDGSELKKTRSLRKVQLDRETTEDGNLQMNFLETLLSDPSGTSLIA